MKGVKLTIVIAAGVFIGLAAFVLFLFGVGRSGNWRFEAQKDAMTDRMHAQAHLAANDGRSAMELSCRQGEGVRLVIQAQERTGGLGDDENYVQRMVRYRLDRGPVRDVVGTLGDRFTGFDETSRGMRRDAHIIDALPNASVLAIETETVRNGRVQLVFQVSGAGRILQRLRDSCAG